MWPKKFLKAGAKKARGAYATVNGTNTSTTPIFDDSDEEPFDHASSPPPFSDISLAYPYPHIPDTPDPHASSAFEPAPDFLDQLATIATRPSAAPHDDAASVPHAGHVPSASPVTPPAPQSLQHLVASPSNPFSFPAPPIPSAVPPHQPPTADPHHLTSSSPPASTSTSRSTSTSPSTSISSTPSTSTPFSSSTPSSSSTTAATPSSSTSSTSSTSNASELKPVFAPDDPLADSPALREKIKSLSEDVDHYSNMLKRMVKSSKKLQSSAQSYAADLREFSHNIHGFLEKGHTIEEDDVYKQSMHRFSGILTDIDTLLQMQGAQFERDFTTPIDAMVRNHLASLKELFKRHDKVKSSYDSCLHRWSHLKAKDVAKIEECRQDLAALAKQHQQTTLELATAINKFQSHKTITVLDRFVRMMFTHVLYFRHGNQLFLDFDPFLSEVAGHIQARRAHFLEQAAATNPSLTSLPPSSFTSLHDSTNTTSTTATTSTTTTTTASTISMSHNNMNNSNSTFNNNNNNNNSNNSNHVDTQPNRAITIQGYLFKKGKNVVQPWQRRYFAVEEGFFIAYKTIPERKEVRPVPVINLLLCTVKLVPDPDRRFCFELVSPTCTYLLQAPSQDELMTWIAVIQNAIQAALDQAQSQKSSSLSPSAFSPSSSNPGGHASSSPSASSAQSTASASATASPRAFSQRVIAFTPSCALCAECGDSNPCWASISLGVTVCIECSGIHRSMGVHISKIRSLTLDDWSDSVLGVLMAVGNARSNAVFEARYGAPDLGPDSPQKPNPKSDRPCRERFIRAKYADRRFVAPTPAAPAVLNAALMAAIRQGDIEEVVAALARGADARHKAPDTGLTAMHLAIVRGNIVLCEYLFQNGSRVNEADARLRTPLHDAASAWSTRLCAWLFEHGADLTLRNDMGQTAVDIAVSIQAADVVTLLRLAALQAEEAAESKHHAYAAQPQDNSLNSFIVSLLGTIPTAEEDVSALISSPTAPSATPDQLLGIRQSRHLSSKREAINLGRNNLFPSSLKDSPLDSEEPQS